MKTFVRWLALALVGALGPLAERMGRITNGGSEDGSGPSDSGAGMGNDDCGSSGDGGGGGSD